MYLCITYYLVYTKFKPKKKCMPFITESKSGLKSIVQVKSGVIIWQIARKLLVYKSVT